MKAKKQAVRRDPLVKVELDLPAGMAAWLRHSAEVMQRTESEQARIFFAPAYESTLEGVLS